MTAPRELIAKLLGRRGLPVEDCTESLDFISAGLVDSLSLLRFVLELEEELGVTLSNDEVASPEFRTVGGLCGLLERKVS